jgi:hypothetical protein
MQMEQLSNQSLELALRKLDNLFKGDIVFVAGVSEYKRGIKEEFPNDIDVVVKNLSPLHRNHITYGMRPNEKGNRFKGIGIIPNWEGFKVEIFYDNKLPEFDTIERLKYQTVEDSIKYYKETLDLYPEEHRDTIKNRIKRLESTIYK